MQIFYLIYIKKKVLKIITGKKMAKYLYYNFKTNIAFLKNDGI